MLSEYERLKDEQKVRIGFRDNLIYATIASIAAVVAATLSARGNTGMLLLIPPVCLVLGWTYLVNDEKVSAIGRYIRTDLGPQLAKRSGVAEGDIFGWENAHRSDRDRVLRKWTQLVVDCVMFCGAPVTAVVVYWVAGHPTALLSAVGTVEVAAAAALGVQVARYADLAKGR